MARKDRLGQEPRRIMSGDVLKVLGAIMTVQASLGRLLAFQTVPDLGALGQAEALVQAQSLLEGGSGTIVAVAYVLQMAANFAWPVFAFLAVQGFLYTSNLKFYLLRLSIFALVSEIPYDLVTSGLWFNWGDQNVLFTILFGLLALTLSEELSRRSNSYFPRFAMLIGGVLWVAADGGQYLRAVDMDVGNQRRVCDPIDDSAAAVVHHQLVGHPLDGVDDLCTLAAGIGDEHQMRHLLHHPAVDLLNAGFTVDDHVVKVVGQ